ncbi:MAG TPA: NUDIX hydrolase, partial [Pseudomonas sp.]|nr:NUDIX hydrolase [Pseudomonas sp.]
WNGPLRLQPEEVLEALFLTPTAILEDARQRPYCPDSLEALQLALSRADVASLP